MPNDAPLASVYQHICGHLEQRTAVLFLGAGVNHGTTNPKGGVLPLAVDLARSISKELLDTPDDNISLDEASEIARYRLGEKELNEYLFRLFDPFKPTNAHLSIVQLPWDCIYTTNYDLLIEKAAASELITPAGPIKPVFSSIKDLSQFSDEDTLYYKLHGSIEFANTPEGRLILTKEDYRHYELHRKPLFRRLAADLLRKTFVFVGYSFSDANFRELLDHCRQELNISQLPLSYAVRRSFNAVEESFWREKYNIQLIDADAFAFLTGLKDTWLSVTRHVTTFEERRNTMFALVDQATRFPRVGESFYRILPSECNAASDAALFFRGSEPSWADIRDGIAPKRDAHTSLMEGLFADFADPAGPLSTYLVTGHAGTGKTTLIRTVAYEAAHDYGQHVFVHIAGSPLDARLLIPFVDPSKLTRLVVIVHHAADYILELEAFIEEARRRKLPLSIILEERKNQWTMRLSNWSDVAKRFTPAEFEIGALSDDEIDKILEALEKFHCLGRLAGTPPEHRHEHFSALAEKELLVALRELTTEGTFDDIIRDEYEQIPSTVARMAYVYVAAIGQIQLPLRYEVAARLLNISSGDLGKLVFRPADGILISGEVAGGSRHNAGFRLTARHPVIASIIFAEAAKTDSEKFEIVTQLISNLDPGYPEDRRILEGIVRRKELVNTFADLERRRELFDILQQILPDSAFVLQHRSILERDLEHSDNAIAFARQAVALDRRNPTVLNTLALALEYGARQMKDLAKRRVLTREAEKIFDDAINRNPRDPFAYVGKMNLIRHHDLELEGDPRKRAILHAAGLSLLEEAFETTNGSTIIAGLLADQRKYLGNTEEAVTMLQTALENKPEDSRVRDLLITYLSDWGKYPEALKVALAGVKFDPNSWRLQRHVARMMRKNRYAVGPIRSAYEAAIRHKRGDVGLAVEFAAFLFMNGQIALANEVFDEVRASRAFVEEKRQIREWWNDDETERPIVFAGVVKNIRGGTAHALAIPENFEAFFWRTESWIAALREEQPIQFQVGFNGLGPSARLIKPVRR